MTLLEQIAEIETKARDMGLTIDELCERAGIDRATWQRWKAGKASPVYENLTRVRAVVEGRAA